MSGSARSASYEYGKRSSSSGNSKRELIFLKTCVSQFMLKRDKCSTSVSATVSSETRLRSVVLVRQASQSNPRTSSQATYCRSAERASAAAGASVRVTLESEAWRLVRNVPQPPVHILISRVSNLSTWRTRCARGVPLRPTSRRSSRLTRNSCASCCSERLVGRPSRSL